MDDSSSHSAVYGRYEFVNENPLIGIPSVIILGIASIIGTCGNLLIQYSVFSNKNLQNVDTIFIINLSLSDLYVTVIAQPMNILAKLEGEEFFNSIPGLCQTIASICTVSCVSSMMTIAVMSINRYFYICRNDTYKLIFTKTNSIIICVSLYGIGILLVLCNTFGIGDHNFDRKSIECIWDRMATFPFTVAFSICLVWIPSLITGICFLKIFFYVRYHRRKIIVQQCFTSNQKVNGRSYHLAKTLFLIYAVFVTCWAPYALLIALDHDDSFSHEIHVYITMFAHLHPSMNWLIYYLTNKNFADAYKQVLARIFKCKSMTLSVNTSIHHNTIEIQRSRTPQSSDISSNLIPLNKENAGPNYQCQIPGAVMPTIQSETNT